MALDELIPNTMDVVEPKAKKKYKTKKEKEKDITMEKLVVMVQTMVNDEFHDEEAQSLKDLVEKTMKAPPQKTKNKKIGKDEVGMNKAKAHEITPSLVMWKRGEDKVSMGLPRETPTIPKKNKGKENVLELIVQSLEHMNFHLPFKSNGDVHSLILPLNGPMKGKGDN